MFLPNLMAIHPVVVESGTKWWINQLALAKDSRTAGTVSNKRKMWTHIEYMFLNSSSRVRNKQGE